MYSNLKKETDDTFDVNGHLEECVRRLHDKFNDGEDSSRQRREEMRAAVDVMDRLLPTDSRTMRAVLERFIEERALCVKIDSECHKGVFDDGFRALLSEGEHRLTAQAHFCHNLQHVQFQSLPGCFIKACADKSRIVTAPD